MNEEIWKPIPGYEDRFEASGLGKIRSLSSGKELKQHVNNAGYALIYFRQDKKSKGCFVHRLILLTFVGPCPPGKETRHKDNNRLNNKLNNLEYCTHLENIRDKKKFGTDNGPRGDYTRRLKELECDISEIRDLLSQGKPISNKLISSFYEYFPKPDASDDGKRTGRGIFVPLSLEEKQDSLGIIRVNAPNVPSGRFARTALFYYLHRIEREGYSKILADILGA